LLSFSEDDCNEEIHKIIDQSQVDKVIKEALDNSGNTNDMLEKQVKVFLHVVAKDLTVE
jgi:hypothetical protein